ncbi:MAG TPA: O-antigen ligase family protein [Actinophytocola sp.]|uniref:O-antigen ligase family protein n=1 Tax=Actinophytocola sp. TaxID=1872138 RepID=UPI002E0A8140|nr:O-antigen ligase family protein [Actinophytocola sp.]
MATSTRLGRIPLTALPAQALSHRARPRIALMLVLIAAAMPVRIPAALPLVHSMSVLDILLWFAAVTLVLDCAVRPLNVAYPQLFSLLFLPVFVCVVSLAWSQDPAATLRSTMIYVEGLVAYLLVVRELDGLPAGRVMTYLKRYTYLVMIPAVLLLLHVPGFAPQEAGLSPRSGSYVSYYTRLSHPVLGRSNNLATVLVFFVPLLLYWGHTRRDRRFTTAGFVVLTAVVLTLSRGVLLALLVTAVVAALGWAVRHRGIDGRIVAKAIGAVAAAVTGITLFDRFNPSTQEFIGGRLSLDNVMIRSDLVSAAVHKLSDRPFLGYGGGVVPDQDPTLAIKAHNTYLQQAIYYGLPLGLVVTLSLVCLAAFFLHRAGRTALASVVGFTVAVQMLIFVTESSFEGTVLRVLFYLSIGFGAALVRAAEAPSGAP